MSHINQRLVEARLRELYEAGERAGRIAGARPRRQASVEFVRRRKWPRIRRVLASVGQ